MKRVHEWVYADEGLEAQKDPGLLLDEMDLELRKVREAQAALEEFVARHGIAHPLPHPLRVLKAYCVLLEDLVDARWRLLNRAREYQGLTGETLYFCERCYDFYGTKLAARLGQKCAGCGGDLVPQDEFSPGE